MGWADLLQTDRETVIAPWLGGRRIVSGVRTWAIDGDLPPEHGWYSFTIGSGRKATTGETALADPELFDKSDRVRGYLIGNRLLADDMPLEIDNTRILQRSQVVYLLEPELPRFSRVMTAVHDGRLVYLQTEFPLGPEADVVCAFEDRKRTVDDIPEVTPALHMAFRWQSYWRDELERRARAEEERIRREEEAARRAEQARRQREREQAREEAARRARDRHRRRRDRRAERAIERLPRNRREGARARHEAQRVLAAAGAELLDWSAGRNANQAVVRFRFLGHRFRSVVRVPGLRVIEAGICLTDAHSGERGDDRFTLASLPGVIRQAHNQRQLVILRW